MSLVSSILTAIGYRIGGGITISATSDPSMATCVQWLNETADWITAICAEEKSELGRTAGSITTIAAVITAATKASPCSLKSVAHGFVTGDIGIIKDVSGMTELNDTSYTITKVDADNFTIGVNSSAYTAYTSGGYISKAQYGAFAATLYAPYEFGWIVKDYSRNKITLTREDAVLDRDPVATGEPDKFYVDGSNNINLLDAPDDVYIIKIPYWQIPTDMADGTSTVPFNGLFDNLFIEATMMRALNRDEYDLSFDIKWQSFITERARRVIHIRKGLNTRISL